MVIVEEHEVGEVNSEGALVVQVSGGVEVYEITKIPSATGSLVEDAKKYIFQILELEKLLTDLNRSSDFLYLAFMATIGTGELQARVSKRQNEFNDLCGLCVETTNAMQLGSLAILDRLTLAYSYLLRADERRASRILSKFSHTANSMSAKCGELAHGFRGLKDNVQRDSETAKIGLGDEVRKGKELKELRDKWRANLDAQEATRNALNQDIEGLKNEITKEEAREDEAAFRESMCKIAKVAGIICHPLQYIFIAPGGNGDSKPSPELLQQPPAEEKASAQRALKVAEDALKDAETAETKALDKKLSVDVEEKAANADKEAKLIQLGEAEDLKDDSEKVKQAQEALDVSYATLDELRVQQKEAQEDLDLACKKKSDAEAQRKVAAATLQKIEDEANLAKKVISRRLHIVGQMLEKETLRHEAIEQIADLTSRLESNERQTHVEESAQIALEITSRALDNVIASFSDAQLFWDTMTAFCKGLAAADVIVDIEDEEKESGPAELVQYLKNPDFVRQAIKQLAGWAALASVCAEYEAGAERTRRSVVDHIKASPNEEEARDLIPKFKKELEDELDRVKAQHQEKIKSLDAEAKRLKEN